VTGEEDLGSLPFCYLTTTGRVSGRPHRIEIWFALREGTVYLLSGGTDRSDWVRNLMVSPDVDLEIGDVRRVTRARVVEPGTDEDALARRLLIEKYQPGYGSDLGSWGRTSLPVAIDWS
jgi:deazaflavin-dependent oxidoreductase (nitroreductase family)